MKWAQITLLALNVFALLLSGSEHGKVKTETKKGFKDAFYLLLGILLMAAAGAFSRIF